MYTTQPPYKMPQHTPWSADFAAAKGRAVFFAVTSLLLLLFTFYTFSGMRDSVWRIKEPHISAAVDNLIQTVLHHRPDLWGSAHRPQYQMRVGMWNYNVHLFGNPPMWANLYPAGVIGSYFAPAHVWVMLPGTPDLFREHRFNWFRPIFPIDVYFLMAAAFAGTSLYCTVIHVKSHRGGNLPPDAYAKLCK